MTTTHRNDNFTNAARTPGTRFPVTASLRDALYDLVPLAEPELAILSTPAFLRMERIQQLGFVSKIWPGARHSRYEHSIGVFHLARLAVEQLRLAGSTFPITDNDARTISAAALLHDIGHYPFSHAIEELGPPIVPHEIAGAAIIRADPIAGILRDFWQVDPGRVAAIIAPGDQALLPVDQVLRGILSGPLDVDKLDYLPRDARACNVPYGGVDTVRLIAALQITDVFGGGPRIVLGDKGISPLHSLINARQEMFDNVYWHHTNRACMVMLLRAVQEGMLVGVIDPASLTGMDDHMLLAALEANTMPEPARRLASSLRQRQLHKRAIEISSRAGALYERLGALFNRPGDRRQVEMALTRALAGRLGVELPEETILIDIPKPEKWRTNTWIAFRKPPVGFLPLMPWQDVVGLGDNDFKQYEEHRRMIRIVANPAWRDEVRRHWDTHLLTVVDRS